MAAAALQSNDVFVVIVVDVIVVDVIVVDVIVVDVIVVIVVVIVVVVVVDVVVVVVVAVFFPIKKARQSRGHLCLNQPPKSVIKERT